ncbi:DUF3159 domain-containing protein [Saccharopolyspora sp. HNM0983]|uniref:DUF3159 domain-containing protein n=1 Tax=Saccharopolyspora montiporae TaxID=2781240 RepID=A0A929B4K6_9PSEU|nr:DUF3159 domain-containing protein [Saccharopolyspora sp. HNM0983]MBE9373054.1 DUF3159 domain-containing protein [Saccharopolyspora sp. HNM0983]
MSERDAADGSEHEDTGAQQDTPRKRVIDPDQTLLDQMGGVLGLVYSTVPVIVFVVVSSFAGLMPAVWSAIGITVAIGVFRVVRREPLQPVVSGVLVVAVCALFAYRSGETKDFFLLGIWTSLIYGGVFLVSVLARWPLIGVVWSLLKSQGSGWRKQPAALHAYDIATLSWTAVFAAKWIVQRWLYDGDHTGWLAFARIVMGYPLTAVALLVTIWAIRRADKLVTRTAAEADAAPANPSPN